MRDGRKSDPQPIKTGWQRLRREVHLQDSPTCWRQSCLGRVQDWRCVKPNVPRFGGAGCRTTSSYYLPDLADRYSPKGVRTRSDKERCVRGRHVIKMRPQRDHSRQQFKWRRNMDHAALYGPRSKARSLSLLLHADRSVLMPTKRPVCFGRLIKKNSPDRSRSRSQHICGDGANASVAVQKWSKRLNSVKANSRFVFRKRNERCFQGGKAGFERTSKKLRSAGNKISDQAIIPSSYNPFTSAQTAFQYPHAPASPRLAAHGCIGPNAG